jgi:hypothetical protein
MPETVTSVPALGLMGFVFKKMGRIAPKNDARIAKKN